MSSSDAHTWTQSRACSVSFETPAFEMLPTLPAGSNDVIQPMIRPFVSLNSHSREKPRRWRTIITGGLVYHTTIILRDSVSPWKFRTAPVCTITGKVVGPRVLRPPLVSYDLSLAP